MHIKVLILSFFAIIGAAFLAGYALGIQCMVWRGF